MRIDELLDMNNDFSSNGSDKSWTLYSSDRNILAQGLALESAQYAALEHSEKTNSRVVLTDHIHAQQTEFYNNSWTLGPWGTW